MAQTAVNEKNFKGFSKITKLAISINVVKKQKIPVTTPKVNRHKTKPRQSPISPKIFLVLDDLGNAFCNVFGKYKSARFELL